MTGSPAIIQNVGHNVASVVLVACFICNSKRTENPYPDNQETLIQVWCTWTSALPQAILPSTNSSVSFSSMLHIANNSAFPKIRLFANGPGPRRSRNSSMQRITGEGRSSCISQYTMQTSLRKKLDERAEHMYKDKAKWTNRWMDDNIEEAWSMKEENSYWEPKLHQFSLGQT